MERKAYPRDVSEEEWALVAPSLPRMTTDAPQRAHRMRAVCNGLRWIVRAGAAWRMMPPDLPPWLTVYQHRQRWLTAGVFTAIMPDLRAVLRLAAGRTAAPSAAIFDRRTVPSTPDRGTRAGYDGAKRRRGSQGHRAVETLGHLLALHVTAAKGQAVTGDAVEVAFVNQGYTGAQAAEEAQAQQMRLTVIKLPAAKKGLVLLPRRWVVEVNHL